MDSDSTPKVRWFDSLSRTVLQHQNQCQFSKGHQFNSFFGKCDLHKKWFSLLFEDSEGAIHKMQDIKSHKLYGLNSKGYKHRGKKQRNKV